MKAILPAAGYATRLHPLTLNKPKALLQVGRKKRIEHIIEKIEEINEIDEIHIVTNEKFYQHFEEWKSKFESGKKIIIHNDKTKSNEERLGTMGDVDFVIEQAKIHDNLLIINADNLFGCSLRKMIYLFHEKNNPVLAVKDLNDPAKLAKKFGAVLIDKNKKVINFEETKINELKEMHKKLGGGTEYDCINS